MKPLTRAAASLLSAALEQARELTAEREARWRQEALSALVPIVASTLDIREIFQRVSTIAKEVLPHEALGILALDAGRPRPALQ